MKSKSVRKIQGGAWTDKNHPELKTQADVNRYLARFRNRFRRSATKKTKATRRHLAEAKGWLDGRDAFFLTMARIVEQRRRHRSRRPLG